MISFVIVNYNSKELTSTAILSIDRSIVSTPYEIIIVDNCSTDGSRDMFEALARERGNLVYIYCDHNHGFGRANNIGAEVARGEYLVLINPDTEIPSLGFDEFISGCLLANVGVVAPAVVYGNGAIQANGGGYSTIFTFIFQNLRLGYYSRKLGLVKTFSKAVNFLPFLRNTTVGKYLGNFQAQSPMISKYDWVSGSCMIMQKSVFSRVGGFDDGYFMYVEDEDLCRRVAELGLEIRVDRRFTIVHTEGGTQKKKSIKLGVAQRARHFSNLRYLAKFYGNLSSWVLRAYYVLAFSIGGVGYLVKLQPSSAVDRFGFALTFLFPRRTRAFQ